MVILSWRDSKPSFRPKPFVTFAPAIILFCSVVITSLSAQTNGPSKPESDVIRGTVVNSQTHEPIGHALVYSPDNRLATMTRSEEHTSELQSQSNLVCRLLLEKQNKLAAAVFVERVLLYFCELETVTHRCYS